jgi:hypothetical protein
MFEIFHDGGREGFAGDRIGERDSSETVRHGCDLPSAAGKSVSVAEPSRLSIAAAPITAGRNSLSLSVNPPSSDRVSINMSLAREGAAIAAAIARREALQYWEDLIADALYDHEQGNLSHRRQAEAVRAALLAAGVTFPESVA